MNNKITLNKDKTIKFIRCKKCDYPIDFIDPITLEELKYVSFDCPKCLETYFYKNNKIITSNENSKTIREELINSFNNIFRRRIG